MNRNQKTIFVLPAILIFSVLSIVFLPHAYADAQPTQVPQGPQCGTAYTIIYSDPTKFDDVKTIDSLKQSLSSIDFSAEVLDGHQWWDYMNISKPDNNSTSILTIPTVSSLADKIVIETIQGLDGVSKVGSTITTWCN